MNLYLPLAVDPNSVVAGWIPLVLTLTLAAAVVLIFFSMRKQLRRINIPDGGVPTQQRKESESDSEPGSR